MLVAPSMLAADFGNMASEVKNIERWGADIVHCDVMDGVYVPNITFGMPMVKAFRCNTNLPIDAHLMINEPEKYILQVRLKNIILNAQGLDELMAEGANMEFSLNTTQMRCATLMFSLIPVLIVYPFLQKYFVKGVMIGSVKG